MQGYSVKAFAQMAGVSVRTLHYYDERDLLKPSGYRSGNHRVYRSSDLLRLQQILTLKYMGFSLDEIKTLLSNPAYEIKRSLEIQKTAIDRRIAQLQQVSRSLARTLEELRTLPEDGLDWSQVGAVIRGLPADDKDEWVRRYYDDETWAYLDQRRQAYTPEQMQATQDAWRDLIAAFIEVGDQPPESPDVQALAAQMHTLLEVFTGGNPNVSQQMSAMYQDVTQIPVEYRVPGHDQVLQDFMMQALTIYQNEEENR